MKNRITTPQEISPERIRMIREKLNLSQSEAGELIGGGPRAFTKYESGSIKPAASIIKLLQILDENPIALQLLTGKSSPSIKGSGRSPFEVSGKHIKELDEKQLVYLVRRLLVAEAFSYSLPFHGIHVAEIITAPDGGEDARIEWQNGPESTPYLKCRLNQFQSKSGKIISRNAGKEILDKKKNIKPMVRSVLEKGGSYTLLCACSYVKKEILNKEAAIRETARNAGLDIKDYQVAFFDAGMIAEWVNTHPSVAVWLLEKTEISAIGRFKSWSYWKSSPDHKIELVEDSRIAKIREKLFPHLFLSDPKKIAAPISMPHSVRRIVGYAWIGKSRLVLEALNIHEGTGKEILSISVLVLYFDNRGDESNAVKLAVQNLADSTTRAIVVVDQCSAQMHEELVNLIRRPESKLSLITIDDELSKENDETILIPTADKVVIEGILKKLVPNLPSEDCRRLVKFSQGFTNIAVLLGEAWRKGNGIVDTFDKFVKTIVIGQEKVDPDLILRGAQVLSVFGVVYETDFEVIAKLGRHIGEEDLRSVINKLERRGLIQRKGKAFVVQPRPIALCLAKTMWDEWSKEKWDDIIITSSLSENLKERATGQLALLNTEDTEIKVGKYLLRKGGPLDSVEKISQPGRAKIFSNLSEIDVEAAVSLLERLFKNSSNDDLKKIDGDTRRHIVWALEKICFRADTFERGAKIMLDFAVAENETWGNNSTGQFKSLFPIQLGNTAADASTRLAFIADAIKEAVNQNNISRISVIIKALTAGAEMIHFSRSVGSETHGSRPALESWKPKTWKEWFEYIENFCDHLIDLAKRKDSVGREAKNSLGHKFKSLATRDGLLHVAEKAVNEVTAAHGNYWPEAYEGLGNVFEYDRQGLSEESDQRIQNLIDILKPKTLDDKILILITQMPWDYPCEQKMTFAEKGERQKKDVEDFAMKLIKSSEDLEKVVKAVCIYEENGSQSRWRRNTALFGTTIAKKLKSPIEWLDIIIAILQKVEPSKRDMNFLAGFLLGINDKHPSVVEKFKEEISHNDFAPALLTICAYIGIEARDVLRVINCTKDGLIKPSDLWQWSGGGVLKRNLAAEEVSPLFDFLFSLGHEGFCIGLDLMGMYVYEQREVLNQFMPQVKLIAEKCISKERSSRNGMDEHHFQEIMKYFLNKGRDNQDARSLALILARQIASLVEVANEDLIKPLIPKLLSDFSEISWPLIGQMIVSDRKAAWKFENLLGDKYSFGEVQNPAILSLPVDTLFAWCHANPEIAPAFAAAVVPVLTSQNPEEKTLAIHPVMQRLLDKFGAREDVLMAISCNIGTYGWSGSRTTYYELYEMPFKGLENHPIKQVRFWAQKMIQDLGLQKNDARDQDEEYEAQWSV